MITLPRQVTDYTCGPASLAAVTRLCGADFHAESDIAAALGSKPMVGTGHEELAD